MWGGVAGLVMSIVAIVVLFLIRGNIIDTLDSDAILYDKNYELKKDALQRAFDCLDHVSQNGVEIKNNPQYLQVAREAYNALLCCVNSPKIYQEFYKLAIDKGEEGYTIEDIEKFKIVCRIELIGRKKKSGEGFHGAVSGNLNSGMLSGPMRTNMGQRPQPAPQQAHSTQSPSRPAPQPRPQQPAPNAVKNQEEDE